MPIDIVYIILLGLAVWKGWNKGLIVATFSFLAIIVALAAALKCSDWAATVLTKYVHITASWLPFVAFLSVFIAIVLLIKMIAAVLQQAVKMMLLGWADKIGGILLFAVIYTLIYSVVLFFAVQLALFNQQTLASSKTFLYIEPIGPKVINGIGKIVPIFKNLFTNLQSFFSKSK